MFTPPDCEAVDIACTPSGRLSSWINLKAAPHYPNPELVYSVHVKTQFAGPDIHVALALLLKDLEKKYFQDMKVYDEGDYWNTLDRVLPEHLIHSKNWLSSIRLAFPDIEHWYCLQRLYIFWQVCMKIPSP